MKVSVEKDRGEVTASSRVAAAAVADAAPAAAALSPLAGAPGDPDERKAAVPRAAAPATSSAAATLRPRRAGAPCKDRDGGVCGGAAGAQDERATIVVVGNIEVVKRE